MHKTADNRWWLTRRKYQMYRFNSALVYLFRVFSTFLKLIDMWRCYTGHLDKTLRKLAYISGRVRYIPLCCTTKKFLISSMTLLFRQKTLNTSSAFCHCDHGRRCSGVTQAPRSSCDVLRVHHNINNTTFYIYKELYFNYKQNLKGI